RGRVPVRPGEGLPERAPHRPVEGVALPRPVERDQEHRAVALQEDGLERVAGHGSGIDAAPRKGQRPGWTASGRLTVAPGRTTSSRLPGAPLPGSSRRPPPPPPTTFHVSP